MKKFLLILTIPMLLAGCGNDDFDNTPDPPGPDETVECIYQEFNPALQIQKFDSLTLDIDDDEIPDILFFINEGVYVTNIPESISFAYGYGSGNSCWDLIEYGDLVSDVERWYSCLTLAGELTCNKFAGSLDYLSIRKITDEGNYYGWINIETTDSTLIVSESYYSLEANKKIYAGVVDTPDESTPPEEYIWREYNPELRVIKFDSILLDIDDDATPDIKFKFDEARLYPGGELGDRISVTFISDTMAFSIGRGGCRGLLKDFDLIHDELDWCTFFTYEDKDQDCGSRFFETLHYMAIRKTNDEGTFYGWLYIYIETLYNQEKRLSIRESFYSFKANAYIITGVANRE